ncbi:bifunctional hydroxymethylpyrimidine kinase/phosphomethylpyrimidine kinase [Candidatus Nitrosotalea bavarica]|uniref:bifunctional hydroxymethylpyrimidine kinase/phosphomethylpyrimidine kinase n=1 Tax=Candidatus Nitrosotalea bavarica TaxID=1903277 RepID=UPI000C70FC29|nr:bifunctional hydroxymethylpyrimidine kinase/phosphomethylpyrimidine kinase [Candidatus Nitrosotalea bavarica]
MHVLSIAGSDPSSGAGIQGDMKTFNSFGANGLSVVTAITSQNTSRFFGVEPVSVLLVKSQIRSILEDFHIDAIKIGMVYDKQTVRVIHSELEKIKIPIILDPIFKSTTGGILQTASAFSDFKKLLVPLCYIITPNIIEAEKISDIKIKSLKDMKNAAMKIQKMGAKNVIIKGGHFFKGDKVTDMLLEDKKFSIFSHARLKFESHGGGCTFSAALCANIARGKKLSDAVDSARLFTVESIRNATKTGRGLAIIKTSKGDAIENQLSKAISEFCSIESINEYIPECQTNFVYSTSNPSTLKDVIGLEGRIVRTGRLVTIAGHLKYGGSKHVASAVLEMTRKFPSMRSSLNIKYDEKIIKKAVSKGLKVSSYDRREEPLEIREKEGSTVSWGIKASITNLKTPPDIIFHKGGFGKEAMVLIFGKNPADVLRKFSKISR